MRWGVFLPGRLPGKHRKASSGSSAGSHPRGRLTSSPYPDPLPLLCSRGGRGGEGAQRGAGRNAGDPLLRARTGLSFPGAGASLCDLPPPSAWGPPSAAWRYPRWR